MKEENIFSNKQTLINPIAQNWKVPKNRNTAILTDEKSYTSINQKLVLVLLMDMTFKIIFIKINKFIVYYLLYS